ncbi:hypothetical protein L593_11635 [Salinarchaeum sp. Harcht-Bsk1]|uniref:NRDE family protein n=1 Tax=Salinarchaeum sp. Harcht-Bsk1 TaxID=1333523 RepID=UPI0003423297|nr:NRDE family protein [Salinarchaeum sp. Harcht-Bsk1]AGN02270.1 hypothetical protein L593_11635 [Salinarchaeum sp. Harcht-Bsk1]
MCTIAFAWQVLDDAPIAVAANRDEALDRESHPPRVLESDPTVLAPQDAEAGGTWIGVSERGLFVGITNRWNREDGAPDLAGERSRGLLVRDALRADDAAAAVALVQEQVAEFEYAGFNLLVADREEASYLEWDGDLRVQVLDPGVHVIVNPGKNEADERAVRLRGELASVASGAGNATEAEGVADASSPSTWLDAATERLRDHDYEVCLHHDRFGTRSSSLVTIGADGATTYDFADGPPCETAYAPVEMPAVLREASG